MSPTPPLKLYSGGVENIKCIKMLGPWKLRPYVTLYNTKTETMLKNKLSEEKRENPVGKTPLKLNTESSLDHPDELTPNSERR